MPHERFFTTQPLQTPVVLEDTEFHHICHVMRARVGEKFELINGNNQLAEATLTNVSKKHAELHIDKVQTFPPPEFPLILAQGIPRFNRLEMILEKGTELGVTEFWLFPGLLSEKCAFSPNQLKRIEQILISAMKQCGRLDLPTIVLTPPLLQWNAIPGTLFFGDTAPDAPWLWHYAAPLPKGAPILLFIGPESGFHPRETSHLLNSLNAHGVKLHPNILRTETAPLAALSLLQVLFRK